MVNKEAKKLGNKVGWGVGKYANFFGKCKVVLLFVFDRTRPSLI